MKIKNIQFYVIMILGLTLSLSFSIFEFIKLNSQSGIINLITAAMFTMLILHKYLVDKNAKKALKVLNWIIMLFVFICIAAESGIIF
ncbi:hypothetical protein [Lactobacillus sp. PSON]|uniref:hypothetical protein n=1 Tax=Lactobacillus sp. PSON TaxID=3455454 RepID=UPI00404366B2